MITIRDLSQTLAALPNSRLKTPMVPGPQTSWVIRMSAFTQTLSPACTRVFPEARARIFSVSVILNINRRSRSLGKNTGRNGDLQPVNEKADSGSWKDYE